jgi:hypothetical protein
MSNPSKSPTDAVLVATASPDLPAMVIRPWERRVARRHDTDLLVRLHTKDKPNRSAAIRNLSRAGAGLVTGSRLSIGCRVQLELQLDPHSNVVVSILGRLARLEINGEAKHFWERFRCAVSFHEPITQDLLDALLLWGERADGSTPCPRDTIDSLTDE